jgi:hypothetical protein
MAESSNNNARISSFRNDEWGTISIERGAHSDNENNKRKENIAEDVSLNHIHTRSSCLSVI